MRERRVEVASDDAEPRIVANLGDVNALDYGGFIVWSDGSCMLIDEPTERDTRDQDAGENDEANDTYQVYRFDAEYPRWLAYVGGGSGSRVSRHHLEGSHLYGGNTWEHRDWWLMPEKVHSLCESAGITPMQFLRMALSTDVVQRACAYQAVANHWGAIELDCYPETFTRAQLVALLGGSYVSSDGKDIR